MGSLTSHESQKPHHHHHRATKQPHPQPTGAHYDWTAQEGGYIPYRFQSPHRRRWRQEDQAACAQRLRDEAERERNRKAMVENYDADAGGEKARLRAKYMEHVGRKRAEAYARQGMVGCKAEERGRKGGERGVGGCDGCEEERGRVGRGCEKGGRGRKKGAKGRGETIRVYASPDLKSRWSE